MKKFLILVILFWVALGSTAEAISIVAKKKYPYPLLTKDYGILSDNDVATYAWGMKPRPFTEKEISGGYIYWGCFRRDDISITLKDIGFSSEDIGWKDNYADIVLTVQNNPYLIHQYEMRSRWSVTDYEKKFNLWRKLMKNEKFVCLAGAFSDRERERLNGKIKETYNWIFERIKTKRGCDCYLCTYGGCNPSYKKYLLDRAEVAQWKKANRKRHIRDI